MIAGRRCDPTAGAPGPVAAAAYEGRAAITVGVAVWGMGCLLDGAAGIKPWAVRMAVKDFSCADSSAMCVSRWAIGARTKEGCRTAVVSCRARSHAVQRMWCASRGRKEEVHTAHWRAPSWPTGARAACGALPAPRYPRPLPYRGPPSVSREAEEGGARLAPPEARVCWRCCCGCRGR